LVTFDRYAEPPKFCTNCEKKVFRGMMINLLVPIGILLILVITIVVLAVTLTAESEAYQQLVKNFGNGNV